MGVLFYPRSDGQYILLGDTVMAVFVVHYYTVSCSNIQWVLFFFLRSDIKYILVSDTIMAVYLLIFMLCDVLIDCGRSFFLMSDIKYILVSDTIMAVFLFIIILCDVLVDRWCSFLFKVRCTIYFS